jgi:O-antigen/teichoic acid export membrane protein
MNSAGIRVVKNASILMAAQLITWILSLLLTIFLPRYLGAAATGIFVLAGSIWSIMGLLISFGTDTLLTKEIARQPASTPELLGMALLLRMFFFILSCGAVAIYLQIMAYPPQIIYVVWLVGLSWLIIHASGPFQSALQGLERMQHTSIANIVSKAVNTILGITVVLLGYNLYAVGYVSIISAIVSATLLFAFVRRSYRPRFQFRIEPAISMIRAGLPYLMSGMGLILYGQVDVLIISSLINTREVGWYGVASQLTGTLVFIPVVFTTAIFPTLTRAYNNKSDSFPDLIKKSFDLMLLLSLPIGFGIFVIANPLVVLLFGPDFAPSGSILSIMGIVIIFMYQNILIGQFLISTDRTNVWTIIMFVAIFITIVLDLLFVPWCERSFGNGAIGGALSYLITECCMCIAGICLLPKGSLSWSNARTGAMIVIAGLIMMAASWWVRDMFIAIPVILGAFTYISLIAILRVVPSEDIALFKEMAQGIIRKLRRREPEPVGITGV